MRGKRGFTLLELLVALAIGGLVVLLAHQVFASVGHSGRRLRDARAALDREANARRWLRATFLSLEVGLDSACSFDGRANRVRFTAWQLTPEGWFERRSIDLEEHDDRLVARVAPGAALMLTDSVQSLAFDYLLEPGAESRWVREWVSPVSAPLAVRMRITRRPHQTPDRKAVVDTMLFLVKERG